jgi:hypothetical protein
MKETDIGKQNQNIGHLAMPGELSSAVEKNIEC